MLTVKELKDKLSNYPDDAEVVISVWNKSNMEVTLDEDGTRLHKNYGIGLFSHDVVIIEGKSTW